MPKELHRIVKVLVNNKAPGPDGLDNILIKVVHQACPKLLVKLCGTYWRLGDFPTTVKIAQIVLFLMVGKGPNDPRSYRPVSLLPPISKVVERVILSRLNHFLSKRNIIHQAQFGFKQGTPREHALTTLLDRIKENLNNGLHTAVVSIDIQEAFGSLCWPDVVECLERIQCPIEILRFLGSYLSDRKVQITMPNGQRQRRLVRVCPQGSCLRPVLWNLVANTIFDLYNGRKGPLRRNPTIRLLGHPFRTVSQLKYLGVIIDNRLNWIPHLQNIHQKVVSLTNNMRRTTGMYWGIRLDMLKIRYRTITERGILYWSSAWGIHLTGHLRRRLFYSVSPTPLNY
ncbi:RNA-directed DNA polymerase from mobile element jockey, partial [Stegodyphus mimosarum]